jgi:hypothetical protein
MFPSALGATCLVAGLGALPRLSRKVIRDLGTRQERLHSASHAPSQT